MGAHFTEDDVRARLVFYPDWQYAENAIAREFIFADFNAAMQFILGVALEAEKMNHHPDWSNSYNRVNIRLTTHDAGGVTQRDFSLAERIQRLADLR